jgi:hypothetical protein
MGGGRFYDGEFFMRIVVGWVGGLILFQLLWLWLSSLLLIYIYIFRLGCWEMKGVVDIC